MVALSTPCWAAIAAAAAIAGCASGSPARHRTAPAPARAPTPPGAAPSSPQLGANTGLLFNSRLFTPAQIAAQLHALSQTGATVARSDASWEATEPAPPTGGAHRYDWTFDDTIAGSLAAARLRWMPIVDYSPPWAQSVPGQDHSPPSNPADYAAYAGALAERYGPGGSFWRAHPELPETAVDTYEIWNEPDNPTFWRPAPNPAVYADLYRRARAAITAVAPTARVIVGGLTNPGAFLPALLAAAPDLAAQLDGVAIHAYGRTPSGVLDRVRGARSVLRSLSLPSVALYVTELGWTTSPPGAPDYLPEPLRPGYIQRTVTVLGHTDCGLAAELLYTWVTPERNPQDSQDWFGISPPGGGSTPDTVAFALGLRAARLPAAGVSC